MADIDFQLKFLLLGDGGVGKTSLRRRFMGEGFSEEYLATIGVDLSYLPYQYEKFNCSVVIWDIAGQDSFRNARKLFYSGVHSAMFVLDLTRPLDIDKIRWWLNDLTGSFAKNSLHPIFLGILANKSDLADQRVPTDDELNSLIETLQAEYGDKLQMKLFLTSALTGDGVDEAFDWEITMTIEKIRQVDPTLF